MGLIFHVAVAVTVAWLLRRIALGRFIVLASLGQAIASAGDLFDRVAFLELIDDLEKRTALIFRNVQRPGDFLGRRPDCF